VILLLSVQQVSRLKKLWCYNDCSTYPVYEISWGGKKRPAEATQTPFLNGWTGEQNVVTKKQILSLLLVCRHHHPSLHRGYLQIRIRTK
jgi:hypothetical protein